MKLREEQIRQFEQDGYLVVEGVLSDAEIEALRRRIEEIATGRAEFPDENLEYEPGVIEDQRRMENLNATEAGPQAAQADQGEPGWSLGTYAARLAGGCSASAARLEQGSSAVLRGPCARLCLTLA